MGARVDHAGFVLDLRAELGARPSWGTSQLRELIDHLEQRHRIPSASSSPLTDDDPRTSPVMGAGAGLRSSTDGDPNDPARSPAAGT